MRKSSNRNSNASINDNLSSSHEEFKALKGINSDQISFKQRRSSSVYHSSFERPKILHYESASNRSTTRHSISSTDSPEDIKKFILSLSKADINQRDIFGRTLLHLAVSYGQYDLVATILEHPHIDPTLQDFENGWTALHRAFYNGYILCAVMLLEKSYECIAMRDRCKQRPLDLLQVSSVSKELPVPKNWSSNIGGSHLLAFGANTNHTLGFADYDNRAFAQVVELRRDNELYSHELVKSLTVDSNFLDVDSTDDSHASDDDDLLANFSTIPSSPRLKFRTVRIKDIQISKLHSAVVTTDPTNNLLICGLALGGRLGLGPDSGTTQYTFQAIPRFNKTKVLSVALGLDHTLALTPQGVFSWGSNQFGQLGTNVEMSKDSESPTQYMPRKVNSDFGLDRIQGVAASQYHSVAFTDTQLYFWGKNIGQMGSLPTQDLWQTKRNPICDDGGVIVPLPQVFPHLPSPVQMVAACDIATICLLFNSHVWVFMNGGHFRVQFPFKSAPSNDFEHYQPTRRITNAKIVKISCSPKGAVCALDDHGAIYAFSLSKHYIEPTRLDEYVKANQIAKSLKVSVVWDPKLMNLGACDADIADDESIIVCTVEGSVWKRIKRSKAFKGPQVGQIDITINDGKKKYHYERVPYLNKVFQVRCDRLFSDFAAIRDDDGLKYLTLDETDISDDLANIVPFAHRNDLQMQAQYLAKFSKRRLSQSFNRQKKQKDTVDLLLQDDVQYTVGRSLLTTTQLIESNILRKFSSDALNHLSDFKTSPFKNYFGNIANTRYYDMAITFAGSDTCIPVHKFMLLARIPILRSLFDGQVHSITGLKNLEIIYDSNSTPDFQFGKLIFSEDMQEIAVKVMIYYTYTDKYIKPWDKWVPPEGIRQNRAYEDFHRLITALDLQSIRYSLNSSNGPVNNLGKDLLKMLHEVEDSSMLLNSNVNIVLADGSLKLHSYILSARSAYFATVLSERWALSEKFDQTHGEYSINLSHISIDIFDVVVKYIYGDELINCFDNIGEKFEAPKHFVAFVLRVMNVASELTLVKLFQACEVILADFITMKNVGMLLESSIEYTAEQLQITCLEFITQNLDCILEKNYLGNIKINSFMLIDEYVRKTTRDRCSHLYDKNQGENVIFTFLNDLTEHNEKVSSLVPIIKQEVYSTLSESAFSPKQDQGNRRRSSAMHTLPSPLQNPDYSIDSEVFELEMSDTPSSYVNPNDFSKFSPKPRANILDSPVSGWKVVSGRKPSFPTGARPSSSLFSSSYPNPESSPLVGTPESLSKHSPNGSIISGKATPKQSSSQISDATFPKIGHWSSTPRRFSNSKEMQPTRIIGSPDSTIPSTPKQSGISKAMNNLQINSGDSSLGQPSFEGETLSAVIESKTKSLKPAKLSQRERRKMQQDLENNSKVNLKVKEPVKPFNPAAINPWQAAITLKKPTGGPSLSTDNLSSPFAAYAQPCEVYVNGSTSRQSLSAASSTTSLLGAPKMAQIIKQEQREVEIKAHEKAKSLKEIQQEEEFARWWAEESAKVQKEQQFIQELANPTKTPRKHKVSNNKNSKRKPKPSDVNNTISSNTYNAEYSGEAGKRGDTSQRGAHGGGSRGGRGRGGGQKGKSKVCNDETIRVN